MKMYDDMKCPFCGADGKYLYLDERNGWIQCDKCRTGGHLAKSAFYGPEAFADALKGMKSFFDKVRPVENEWGA